MNFGLNDDQPAFREAARLPYQQRLRDVIGLEIGDGTAQIMKLVIAREEFEAAAA